MNEMGRMRERVNGERAGARKHHPIPADLIKTDCVLFMIEFFLRNRQTRKPKKKEE